VADLLSASRGGTPSLRGLIDSSEVVLAPGCYDALGARLVEEAGFPAVYMTGFGSAASRLGRPDVGLMTLPEMVDNAHRIAEAVALPVIADADTGYGNAVNGSRTVHEYEAAGVAAIHLEDQVMPKKCGHMEGKQVIPAGEMAAKVAAAVAARSSPEFLIIARTDARAVEGLAAALDRARRYRDAGADVLFVEAPQSEREIAAVAEAFPGVPLLFNYAEGGRTPAVTHQFLRELGFKIVIFPISTLLAATAAMRSVLAQIRADGSPINALGSLLGFGEFLDFIGLAEIQQLDRRFSAITDEAFGDSVPANEQEEARDE
jgi:2,3-dimethylmalate lyase